MSKLSPARLQELIDTSRKRRETFLSQQLSVDDRSLPSVARPLNESFENIQNLFDIAHNLKEKANEQEKEVTIFIKPETAKAGIEAGIFQRAENFLASTASEASTSGELQQRESASIDVILTADQEKASSLCLSGESCCIIGAAGTGKTTAIRIILQRMRDAGLVSPFSASSKYLTEGSPSIVVLSFTNKAVANIRRGMPRDITCITAHKLIEFQPFFYEMMNAEGEMVKTMRFEPARNRFNKLPHIDIIVFEEASTISTILFRQIVEALSGKTQFIFLGDIQQLPPVYGQAILGFKMLEYPVVELREVMRQALESPILSFAWKILEGKPLKVAQIETTFNKENEFKIRPWKKRLTAFDAIHVASLLMNSFIESGSYDPMNDMILIPFARNKQGENHFCTDELNRSIAQKLGKDRDAIIHEIIAGFHKFYYAVGDKILVKKQEALIVSIAKNADYIGKTPLEPSNRLNRHGHYEFESQEEAAASLSSSPTNLSIEEIDQMMAAASMGSGDIEDRKNQGSHILHCKLLDSEEEVEVQTTGEYAESSFAYALTIHKAQGSEWKRVILLLHASHATMISRELLYTACTRARESLYIICEPEHFEKGILRQRIKGNTLEEKAEFFKGKIEDLNT